VKTSSLTHLTSLALHIINLLHFKLQQLKKRYILPFATRIDDGIFNFEN
jgi:hypothetical protein